MIGISWLAGLLLPKVGEKWARPLAGLIIWGLVLAVAAFLLYRVVDSWGDRRFDQGVALERGKWKEAEKRLHQEAAASATRADDAAAKRLEVHKEQVDADTKAVDEAVRNGTSPLDALFGG